MSVTAYLTQSGLTAKVRARYGRRLSEGELATVAGLGSTAEVTTFLQEREPWTRELSASDGAGLRRAMDKAMKAEFHSLGHFVAAGDKIFWQFYSHQQDLRRLLAEYPRFRMADELYSAAAGTIYEGSVKRNVQGGQLPGFAAMDALLRSRYDAYLLRLIANQYKGKTGQQLKRLLGEATDRVNLLSLLRLKTYFPVQAQTLARYLPAHHRLNQRLYAQLSAAKTVAELRSLLAAEPHFAPLAQLPLAELEQEQIRSLRRLYRQVIHGGEVSVAVAFVYLSDRAYALSEVCAAWETVAEREARKKEATTW